MILLQKLWLLKCYHKVLTKLQIPSIIHLSFVYPKGNNSKHWKPTSDNALNYPLTQINSDTKTSEENHEARNNISNNIADNNGIVDEQAD